MTVGSLFLLIILLIIILLIVAYLHYKWKRDWYKRKGYRDLSDIKYSESVVKVYGYFIAFWGAIFLLYIVITNWDMPL